MVRRSTSCRWLNPLETHLGQNRAHRQTHRSPRTGLLSSMKSSRHSGNSVHCPRSASSTKRLIDPPTESRGNHNSGTAFSHSQDHSRRFSHVRSTSAYPPLATKERTFLNRQLRAIRRRYSITSSAGEQQSRRVAQQKRSVHAPQAAC